MTRFMVPDYVYKAAEIEKNIYRSGIGDGDVEFFERVFYEESDFYPSDIKKSVDRLNLGKRIGYVYLDSLSQKIKTFSPAGVVTMGDANFDWQCIPDQFKEKASPAFICAGAGINVSFEIELAKLFPNSKILILDPSPQSVKEFIDFEFPENIKFLPLGLGGVDGNVKFFKPNLKGVGSLSTLHLNPGDQYFELPIARLQTLCEQEGIDTNSIGLLKFDIEGAEHEVVDDIIASKIFPDQIAFEFDQPVPPWKIEKTIKKLISSGYQVASICLLNILFIKSLPDETT